MRIVVAHESVETEGGAETYLLSTIRELRSRGHQVALLHYRAAASRAALRSSAHVSVSVEERGLDGAAADVAAWRPDVCFSHNMGPLDVDRRMLARWPVVKMLHGFFGTCVSGLKMHAFPSAAACHRTFGPACLALYLPRRCGQMSPAALWNGYRWSADQQRLFSSYAALVVASQFMGDEIARNGADRSRINVVPLFSTLEPATSDVVMREGEPDTILFGGRMTSLKGGHVLIDAAARAGAILGRKVRVLMAGDGPQRAAWQRQAGSLGVETEFTGWVAAEDRPSVYSRGLFLAVPSLWPEPFGLIGLDAAALGKPAVAFDVGGVREWLTDGVSGRLVDPDAGGSGLAKALAVMLDSPEERRRMGCEAANVARRLTVAAHVDRLEPILQAAAANEGRVAS
jgi:glycosyltransferase involved in cell wall biosynthesis